MNKRLTVLVVAAGLAVAGLLALRAPNSQPQRISLATMTAVPRTPRPTLTPPPTASPTGTPVPTSTPGFRVIGIDTPCPGDSQIPADVTLHGEGMDWIYGNARICLQPGAAVRVWGFANTYAPNGAGQGFTALHVLEGDGGTTTKAATCTYTLIGHLFDHGIPIEGCHDNQCVFDSVLHAAPGSDHIDLTVFATGGYGIFFCGTKYSDLARHISDASAPAPGPTPTPAPGCWITEVLAQPRGPTCPDLNGRGGCGTDDEFVEIACQPTQSLAGWKLAASDMLTYTVKADNMTGPLKVFWLDQWPGYVVTTTLPLTGTVRLYNAVGTLVDTRTYYTTAWGNSWAALNWTYPGGAWQSLLPSPGHGRDVTVLPTVMPTHTVTPHP